MRLRISVSGPVIAVGALLSAHAAAAIVTFDDVATAQLSDPVSGPISDQGLTFSSNGFAYIIDNAYGYDGDSNNGTKFYIDGYGDGYGYTKITKTNGGTFDLSSLDIGLSVFAQSATDTTTFTGRIDGGGTVSQVVTLYNFFETTTLYGFDNLDWVTISTLDSQAEGYIAIDNLNTSGPVPEPSTWVTMLFGFVALGFAGYRRSRPHTDGVSLRSGQTHGLGHAHLKPPSRPTKWLSDEDERKNLPHCQDK